MRPTRASARVARPAGPRSTRSERALGRIDSESANQPSDGVGVGVLHADPTPHHGRRIGVEEVVPARAGRAARSPPLRPAGLWESAPVPASHGRTRWAAAVTGGRRQRAAVGRKSAGGGGGGRRPNSRRTARRFAPTASVRNEGGRREHPVTSRRLFSQGARS